MKPNRLKNEATLKNRRLSPCGSININSPKWFFIYFVLLKFEDLVVYWPNNTSNVLYVRSKMFSV